MIPSKMYLHSEEAALSTHNFSLRSVFNFSSHVDSNAGQHALDNQTACQHGVIGAATDIGEATTSDIECQVQCQAECYGRSL